MNNISQVDETACFGCTACSFLCPQGAVEMRQSPKGFYIPSVDQNRCISCGLCLAGCPAMTEEQPDNRQETRAFAVRHQSDAVRYQSSSGGAFTAIVNAGADVVYGAAFSGKSVLHLRVTPDNLQPLRKSKYVQSDLKDSFPCVYDDLQQGKNVAFCGTPCQCVGLKNYLSLKSCNTDKLLLIDFICHGTLSPRMFADYLKYSEQKKHRKILDYCFRGKDQGWHGYQGVTTFTDGKKDGTSYTSQLCTVLYSTNRAYKEACYSCKYASMQRVSDITLGDFWGIEKHLPEFDDNKGVSFVMVNTEKGQRIFDQIENVDVIEVPVSWTAQEHLDHPVARPADNEEFWKYYEDNGFRKLAVKYLKAGRVRRIRVKVSRFVDRLIR